MSLLTRSFVARSRPMPTRRQYKNAPIIETVIEIAVDPHPAISIADLERLGASEKSRYPTPVSLMHGNINLHVNATGSVPQLASIASQSQLGFAFRAPSNVSLFQVRRGAFSYHKLHPYSSWEDCRREARRLWEIYRSGLKPNRITRLGVRYVNRLDLPPVADLGDYLLTAPEIAPGISQEMSSFMMQLHIPQPDIGAMLTLREGLVEPSRPGVASVLLDIDVFRQVSLAPSTPELWDILERLHTRENETFERCITDRTRHLID